MPWWAVALPASAKLYTIDPEGSVGLTRRLYKDLPGRSIHDIAYHKFHHKRRHLHEWNGNTEEGGGVTEFLAVRPDADMIE